MVLDHNPCFDETKQMYKKGWMVFQIRSMIRDKEVTDESKQDATYEIKEFIKSGGNGKMMFIAKITNYSGKNYPNLPKTLLNYVETLGERYVFQDVNAER
jgi:hypothetical protein